MVIWGMVHYCINHIIYIYIFVFITGLYYGSLPFSNWGSPTKSHRAPHFRFNKGALNRTELGLELLDLDNLIFHARSWENILKK
jgi:hypothetical protein